MKASQPIQYPPRAVNLFCRGLAWLTGKLLWSIRFHGRENIPPREFGGYIIASNHQTYLDPGWICALIPHKFQFMAFDEAFGWKFVGALIRYLGAFPIDLGGKRLLKAMKQAIRALNDGAALVVFPEGGRQSADGKLLPFKEGVARLAIQAGVPILPVTITGGNRVWPYGKKWPRFFTRVEVTYHPLIEVAGSDDAEQLNIKLKEAIGSAG